MPQFLTLNDNATSENKAKKNVNELLEKFNYEPPLVKAQWSKKRYTFTFGSENIELSYFDLIQEMRKYGVVYSIQNYLDRSDEIFGQTFGLETPNFQFPVTTHFAGFSKILQSPSRTIPIEKELVSDIIFYREETCYESDDKDFEMCTRNYRAYLFTSISLIDAFINKHILIYNHQGLNTTDFNSLKESRNSDERIELLVKIISNDDNVQRLKESEAWNDYKKLKNLRNNIVHSLEPFFGHSIPEFAEHLNLIRTGVGELLKMILGFQNKFTLGFIEELRNAPEVFYNQIRFKSNGDSEIKKIENN